MSDKPLEPWATVAATPNTQQGVLVYFLVYRTESGSLAEAGNFSAYCPSVPNPDEIVIAQNGQKYEAFKWHMNDQPQSFLVAVAHGNETTHLQLAPIVLLRQVIATDSK